jgi:hypothetical protein
MSGHSAISELSTAAERLRLVKNAYRDFITLWAIDRDLEEVSITDRIYADVAGVKKLGPVGKSGLFRDDQCDD